MGIKEKIERLLEALRWYEAQARDCNKRTPDGDVARNALATDGGNVAAVVLAEWEDEG